MLSKDKLNKIKTSIKNKESVFPLIFNVLGDKNRFQIFYLLANYKDLCVSDLAYILNISIPAVSQHLKILELAGLIIPQKQNKMICYQINLNKKIIKDVLKLISLKKQKVANIK
jgi:DNA-binding transcriptional ArsR family regulator